MHYLQIKPHSKVPGRQKFGEILFNSLQIFILVIFTETFEKTAFFLQKLSREICYVAGISLAVLFLLISVYVSVCVLDKRMNSLTFFKVIWIFVIFHFLKKTMIFPL